LIIYGQLFVVASKPEAHIENWLTKQASKGGEQAKEKA